MKATFLRLSQSLIAIVLLSVSWNHAHAQAQGTQLPMVQNVNLSGNQLTWDAVEGASGYNIQLGFRYFDTVRDGLAYTVEVGGEYTVVAFDDDGNFSPAMFTADNRELFEDAPENNQNPAVATVDSAFIFNECLDLDAGESCVASCPAFLGNALVGSSTGGACSSSGTDFVNSSITPDDYSCTVSSFTARVEATVICRTTSGAE